VLAIVDTSVTTTKKITVTELRTALSSVAQEVLQVVGATDSGAATTSTSLANVTGSNKSITPQSSASHLLIQVQFHGNIGVLVGGNTVGSFQLYDVDNAVVIGQLNQLSAAAEFNGVNAIAPCALFAYIANTVTSARAFQLQAKTSNASAPCSALSQVWAITEIKD